MGSKRWLAGLGLGVLVAAGIAVSPALHAQDRRITLAPKHASLSIRSGIGTFTPAAADPKLAAMLARSGLGDSGFRFTPSESRNGTSSRAVTVAVRARSARSASAVVAAAPPSVNLAPIAYNLGVAVGWKRFAVSGDVTHVDIVGQPGSRDAVDLGISYTGKRVSGRVKANADRPLDSTPRLLADTPSYSIDVGGSYSLTRNLDVTAGVRYKSERERLPQLNDNRRDSQAVYVGTAFRF